MSLTNLRFSYANCDIYEQKDDQKLQDYMNNINKEVLGSTLPNSLLGLNQDEQDQNMHPSHANLPSYKNRVTCEHMDECGIRSEQEQKDEIFWEPGRREKPLRIEERKYGDYKCHKVILSPEEENHISQP